MTDIFLYLSLLSMSLNAKIASMPEAEFLKLSRRSSTTKNDLVQAIVALKSQIPSETSDSSPILTEESFTRILEDRLSKRLDPLMEAIGSLTKENATLKADLKKLRDDHETLKMCSNESLELTINEIYDRQRQQNNVIISGVQEKAAGSLDERCEHDTQIVRSIFKFLDKAKEVDVRNAQRIGRLDLDRPRLLKVELSSFYDRNAILKNAKSLRRSSWDSVFINPDYTEMERVQNRKLREELKRRRNSGEDVVLYRGRIVRKGSASNFW